MKNLVVLLALLFVAAFQANAQTTYSSLEVIDGEHTGNTVDITITRSPSDDVTYTILSRPSLPSDVAKAYDLTGATQETIDGKIKLNFNEEDVWVIPFNIQQEDEKVLDGEMWAECYCTNRAFDSDCKVLGDIYGTLECKDGWTCENPEYTNGNCVLRITEDRGQSKDYGFCIILTANSVTKQ